MSDPAAHAKAGADHAYCNGERSRAFLSARGAYSSATRQQATDDVMAGCMAERG